mmetsp:Transcript_45571/g.90345  ORF Transcript_45571/g.90345 Transcript_45571/m.90345 type:complete len:209 (+) Transcript_45571:155-781(+)
MCRQGNCAPCAPCSRAARQIPQSALPPCRSLTSTRGSLSTKLCWAVLRFGRFSSSFESISKSSGFMSRYMMSITSSCRRPHGNGVSRKLLSSAAKNLYGSSKKSDEGRIQSSNGPRPVLRRSFGRFVPKLTLEALSPLEDRDRLCLREPATRANACLKVGRNTASVHGWRCSVASQRCRRFRDMWQTRRAMAGRPACEGAPRLLRQLL